MGQLCWKGSFVAEEAKEAKLSRSEEIAELRRQMERMSKRLEELSTQEAQGNSEKQDSSTGVSGFACDMTGDVCAEGVQQTANTSGSSSEDAAEQASKVDSSACAASAQPSQKPSAVSPASGANDAAAKSSEPGGASRPSERVADDEDPKFDEAYIAAAVEDFMPQSKPPQPAPPLQGAPGGPYSAAQRENEHAQSAQPYAQQPGQAAYYQNMGASQGGYQGQYQQSYTPAKDHVAAGLLAIFLGVFGVHKFYLGYNTAGFILLGVTILGGIFTFGIAASVVWLIGLIEGVIYLTKSQAEFDQIYVCGKRDWF